MELQVRQLSFPQRTLERWQDGHCDDVLGRLESDSFIRRVLDQKLANRRRPGRRFFGEAFVVAELKPQSAWYGSFKWLTSWPTTSASSFGAEYRAALGAAFPEVSGLSPRVLSLCQHLGGKKPVPPDLWLILNGQHHFIEVKLPRDRVRRTQLAGLAAIATWLAPRRDAVVSVYELYAEGHAEPRSAEDLRAQFRELCELCERA
jgi:hypothetical protein